MEKIVDFIVSLPKQSQELLSELIQVVQDATEEEEARIWRFLDIANERGHGWEGLRMIVAAAHGNQDAAGIIAATLEEHETEGGYHGENKAD